MEKKKKGVAGKAALGGVILLALVGLGVGTGGFGLFGNAVAPAMSETEPAAETPADSAQEQDAVTEPVQEAQNPLQIRVNEDKIFFQGESVTLDTLRDKMLSSYDGSSAWELTDDHARKAEYDAVKALLAELDMPCIEK